LSIFQKSIREIQISLKQNKNNGYLKLRCLSIYDNISQNFLHNGKHFTQILKRKFKINTLYLETSSQICAFYRKMEEVHVRMGQARNENLIWRTRYA
jgi:hypothetical protein